MIPVPLWALHVDGIGELAVRREDGVRCLFLFSGQVPVSVFINSMERPEYTQFTAIPFSTVSEVTGFLSDIKSTTALIAIDPSSLTNFDPIPVDQAILDLRSSRN